LAWGGREKKNAEGAEVAEEGWILGGKVEWLAVTPEFSGSFDSLRSLRMTGTLQGYIG
jgi:hypothetical protein